MRILLYGGTFDPPHNGHLNNLRLQLPVCSRTGWWVMPAGVPPHKRQAPRPAALRLEMCRCFTVLEQGGAPQLEVSRWEIDQAAQGRRNYTVLTLEMLAGRWPEAQLYLAIGSDMLLTFDQWYCWQRILQLAKLVVTSRQLGDDQALHTKAKQLDPSGSRILFAPVEAMPMASQCAADKAVCR